VSPTIAPRSSPLSARLSRHAEFANQRAVALRTGSCRVWCRPALPVGMWMALWIVGHGEEESTI
jgi:hypothetical protein